jgi:CheY-like chemotaxis protein
MKLEDATVLVVDDEKDLREIFGAWLGRKGCKVLTAANGVEALEVLDREKVDVLVSDIRMPIMGGVALVRAVNERKIAVPSIIFVSGFGDVEPREMYGLGVEMLMEKPLSRKDLLQALEESLLDRDELWRTPSAQPMQQSVALEMESLVGAIATCAFQLGRGGCCFSAGQVLEDEKTIDLSIQFELDGVCVNAQGTVRWFDNQSMRAGVSFDYLHPDCRAWTIAAMYATSCRSFIPQCRCEKVDIAVAIATCAGHGGLEARAMLA